MYSVMNRNCARPGYRSGRTAGEFVPGAWFGPALSRSWSTAPSVNIRKTENGFRIDLAAPGMARADFKVKMDGDTLTSSAETKVEQHSENYTRREFQYGSFTRSFTLPESANGEAIVAKYDNGILSVEIPVKKEETNPGREIAVI
jgi:HSP20 family protein